MEPAGLLSLRRLSASCVHVMTTTSGQALFDCEAAAMNGPSSRAENRKRQAPRTRPRIERLEERLAPATFRVNTLLDTMAVNLRNGRDSTGHISLLSAIMAANARGGNNTIILPSGTIAADDFVIDDNLTIKGKSAASTIISGFNVANTRGFEIQGGKVTISKLTIEDCSAENEGGAILNEGGNVELSSVNIVEQRRRWGPRVPRGQTAPMARRWPPTAARVKPGGMPRGEGSATNWDRSPS